MNIKKTRKQLEKEMKRTEKQIKREADKLKKLNNDMLDEIGKAIQNSLLEGKQTSQQLEDNLRKLTDRYKPNLLDIGRYERQYLSNVSYKRFEENDIKKQFDFAHNRDKERAEMYAHYLNEEIDDMIERSIQDAKITYETIVAEANKLNETKQALVEKGTHKQIAKELVTKSDYVDIATSLGYKKAVSMFKEVEGTLYYFDSANRHMHAEYWLKRETRSMHRELSLNAMLDDMEIYGQHLIRTSAHIDASKLCVHYQGRVYSMKRDDEKYEYFPDICMFTGSGTYKHWNCRHHESIYIEGASDNSLYDEIHSMSNEQIEKNYETRQKGNNAKRNADAWTRKRDNLIAIGGSKEEIEDAKRKITYWHKIALGFGVNL